MPSKSILIVDDSVSVRKYLAGILTHAAYNVTEAGSGMEALEKLKTGKFDLLLLDLNLPELSGFEVLRIVKTPGGPFQTLPVLCITGVHRELQDIKKLQELGAAGFIDKEVSATDLAFRVKKILDKSK
jgi:CheY-like chemotaxis protein